MCGFCNNNKNCSYTSCPGGGDTSWSCPPFGGKEPEVYFPLGVKGHRSWGQDDNAEILYVRRSFQIQQHVSGSRSFVPSQPCVFADAASCSCGCVVGTSGSLLLSVCVCVFTGAAGNVTPVAAACYGGSEWKPPLAAELHSPAEGSSPRLGPEVGQHRTEATFRSLCTVRPETDSFFVCIR